MTSNEVIQEVIDKTDMVELVGEFVSLEKSGANYRGLCPFHNENTPSFMVSPEKHLATCFGCHKSLNPIQFVQEVKNISFSEALKYVADKAGVKVNIVSKKTNEPDYSKYYSMMSTASSFYYKNLTETENGKEALEYLEKRGLSKDVIEKFSIGLASDKNDIIYQIYKKLGFLELDMEKTGLVKSSEKGGYHDLFTRRIMFPIFDEHSNLVGFSGRVYRAIDKDQPKYINSPESLIFKKRNNLFNINNAIPEARKMHRFLLCEGQMDVIACARSGLGEAVCSLGTGLTLEQSKLLKKYANDVILMYDNDSAGIAASLTAISLLKSVGLNVSVVLLSGAKDADEYALKYGTSKLKEYVDANIIAPTEFQFLAAVRNKDLLKDAEFESAKNSIFNFLKEEKSQALIEKYIKKLADLSSISFESLVTDFNIFAKRIVPSNNRGVVSGGRGVSRTKLESKYQICQKRLVGYMTLSKKYAVYIDNNIEYRAFKKEYKDLLFDLVNYYTYYNDFDQEKFAQMISSSPERLELYKNIVNSLSKEKVFIDYNDLDLKLCISTIYDYFLEQKKSLLNEELKQATVPEEKKNIANKIFKINQELKKRKEMA